MPRKNNRRDKDFAYGPFERDKIREEIIDMRLRLEFYEEILQPWAELDEDGQRQMSELFDSLITVQKAKQNLDQQSTHGEKTE